MKISDQELVELADQYVAALAGGKLLSALKLHALKAGVNLAYVNLENAEFDRAAALAVFQAARAQGKLSGLIHVVRSEGFDLVIHEFGGPDDEECFDDATYRKWLQDETDNIDIRGIGERRVDEPIVFPLLKLYIELYVQTGLTNLDLDQGRIRGRTRIRLIDMMGTVRCLAIMGDPGSGKTTFLRYVARRQVEQLDLPLPILLRFGDIYDFASKADLPLDDPGLFLEYLVHLGKHEQLSVSRAAIEKLSEAGKCLWLLDSLDELPSDEVREALVRALEKAARRWDRCQFVLTSRPLALKGLAIPLGFEAVGIDHWGQAEIRSFLEAWTALLYPTVPAELRRRRWGALLSTIMERPELQSLAKNAVMVTAMAVVHTNQRRLPEGRADLLEALLYWLVQGRNRRSPVTRTRRKFVEDRYRELALAMFEAEGGPKTFAGRMWAAEKLASHFETGLDGALEFLGHEETETGVLVRRRIGDLAYWHLSFQEYLAAKEIARRTDDPETGWWARIQNHLDQTEWREVIAFVPACHNMLGGDRVDLFFQRLALSCVDSDFITKARRVALGGSVLRDLRLTGYEVNDAPAWNQILSEVCPLLFGEQGRAIPLETRYEAAVAYGLGGDERLRNPEETWAEIPEGTIVIGAQARDAQLANFDPYAAAWEGPTFWAHVAGFKMRKYLITVEEYSKFVLDGGYEEGASKLWSDDARAWRAENKIEGPLDWEEQELTPNCPIVGISWYEAVAYCNWLASNDLRGLTYRLPSEFEWEYAARRGALPNMRFQWGNAISRGDVAEANWGGCFLRRPTPVGMFPLSSTPDGLADMIGNVEEWCLETWVPDYTCYQNQANVEAVVRNDSSCSYRVVRGGSTIRFSRLCRPTYRGRIPAGDRYMTVGFRPVRIRSNGEGAQ